MTEQAQQDGLLPDDVVAVINPSGAGRVVLACEHASNVVPPELNDLGLSAAVLQSHIAWDIGAMAVAEAMSAQLDAPLIAQRVSRLVHDCNRYPSAMDAIPQRSEYQVIPGNEGLSAAERKDRSARYYAPFCEALSTYIEARVGESQALPVLVTVHSFTPVYKSKERTVEIGILHDSDARLANEILKCADEDGKFTVLRNAPYGPEDGVTFTLDRHATPHRLLNVMIEIRSDLIATEDSQHAIAKLLSGWVHSALANHEADQKHEALQS